MLEVQRLRWLCGFVLRWLEGEGGSEVKVPGWCVGGSVVRSPGGLIARWLLVFGGSEVWCLDGSVACWFGGSVVWRFGG